jgi:hypothetical protein
MRTRGRRDIMKSRRIGALRKWKMVNRVLGLTIVVALAGCASTVDKASVRATEGAPVSTQVQIVKIPYDPSLPKILVAVEPLMVGAESSPGAPVPIAGGARFG